MHVFHEGRVTAIANAVFGLLWLWLSAYRAHHVFTRRHPVSSFSGAHTLKRVGQALKAYRGVSIPYPPTNWQLQLTTDSTLNEMCDRTDEVF